MVAVTVGEVYLYLRQYQVAHGLIADAYPTQAMLTLLDSDATKAATKID